MAAATKIRVLCVDAHRIVREGIALIIGRQPDMEVAGLGATGEECLALFRRCRPDITLMDQPLAMSGVDTIKSIRRVELNARIVVLTMYQGHEDIYRALNAGAVTYLLKETLSSDELVRFLREVHAGGRPMQPEVEMRLAERAAGRTLTPREIQVVDLIAEGMRNREIGTALGIAEETVQVHVKNILAKLKVKDRSAAITIAVRRGIIHIT